MRWRCPLILAGVRCDLWYQERNGRGRYKLLEKCVNMQNVLISKKKIKNVLMYKKYH